MLEHNEYRVLFAHVPHVARRLLILWGTREFCDYTDWLFTDTRNGTRRGFPVEVLASLYKITRAHHEEYPSLAAPVSALWNGRDP